jgi:hypothetical protein
VCPAAPDYTHYHQYLKENQDMDTNEFEIINCASHCTLPQQELPIYYSLSMQVPEIKHEYYTELDEVNKNKK